MHSVTPAYTVTPARYPISTHGHTRCHSSTCTHTVHTRLVRPVGPVEPQRWALGNAALQLLNMSPRVGVGNGEGGQWTFLLISLQLPVNP